MEITDNLISGCDQQSRIYCSSFNAIQSLVVEGNEIIVDGKKYRVDDINEIDLASLGLYIGKYIEQEINSSVVQLMRQFCGIDMPDFYCKRDPYANYKDCIVVNNNRKVNLNEQSDIKNPKSLKTIPLGDAYYTLETLKNEDSDGFFDSYQWLSDTLFLDLWRNLFRFRNQVAHTGTIILKDEILKNYDYFLSFLQIYMPKIKELKIDLGPDNLMDKINKVLEKKDEPKIVEKKDLPKATKEAYEELISLHQQINATLAKDTDEERNKNLDQLNNRICYILENFDWEAETIETENGLKGLINASGKTIVPALYENFGLPFLLDKELEYNYFKAIPAKRDGKWGLVKTDGSGTELTEFDYDEITLAPISSYLWLFKKNNSTSYGLLSFKGEELLPCVIDTIYDDPGTTLYFQSGKLYGISQISLGLILPPIYDNIEIYGDLEDPLLFTLNGVTGYVKIEDHSFISLADFEKLDEDEQYDLRLELICEQYEIND